MKVALHAYLDNNLGDDLMVKIISERYKNVVFYIYTENSVVRKTFDEFKNVIARPLDLKIKDLDEVDAVLFIGGSIFIIKSFRDYIGRLFKINYLIKARLRKIPILTVGCNFGPFSALGSLIARIELFFNNMVIVRDAEYRSIYKKKMERGELVESSDFVYSYKYFKKSKFDEKFLGISAYRSVRRPELNYRNYVALAKAADDFINKTSGKVKIFAFDTELENDLSAAHYIFKLAVNKESIEIIPYLGDIDEFLSDFSLCNFHICIRFHSAILADILGVPFYPIAYSNKMINLVRSRYPRFNIEDISELNVESKLLENIREAFSGGACCGGRDVPNVGIDYFPVLDKFFNK